MVHFVYILGYYNKNIYYSIIIQKCQTTKFNNRSRRGERRITEIPSSSSAVNVSKARSKVKAFLKAGKQIIDNSDSDGSGDEIIDLVIRKIDAKLEPEPDVIRRTPLKNV